MTDSFLVGGAGASFGTPARPDCSEKNIEEMKAVRRKNLRMRPSMHANPQRAKVFGEQRFRLIGSPRQRPEIVVFQKPVTNTIINTVAGYLDLSQLYGSATAIAASLRNADGTLQSSDHGQALPNDGLVEEVWTRGNSLRATHEGQKPVSISPGLYCPAVARMSRNSCLQHVFDKLYEPQIPS